MSATLHSPDRESVALDIVSQAQLRRRLSLPLVGEGGPLAVDEVKTASAVAPMRGRGTASAVDEVPTQAPDFVDFPVRRAKRCREAGPRAGALLHERRRGEAHRRQGWVGGVYPSAQLKARTAASDGQHAFTRAARSAEIWFAVRSLSEAIDREKNKVRRLGWHLIHR